MAALNDLSLMTREKTTSVEQHEKMLDEAFIACVPAPASQTPAKAGRSHRPLLLRPQATTVPSLPEQNCMISSCCNLCVGHTSSQSWKVTLSSTIEATGHSCAIAPEQNCMINSCCNLCAGQTSSQCWKRCHRAPVCSEF